MNAEPNLRRSQFSLKTIFGLILLVALMAFAATEHRQLAALKDQNELLRQTLAKQDARMFGIEENYRWILSFRALFDKEVRARTAEEQRRYIRDMMDEQTGSRISVEPSPDPTVQTPPMDWRHLWHIQRR